MRWTRITLFLLIIAFFALLLYSCHCDPCKYEWKIIGIEHYVSYPNGQTLLTYTDSEVYHSNPVGVHRDEVNIKFNEDGTVAFKPYGSEVIYGTYKLKSNKINDTIFTVTFENGEKIENGYAISYYGNDELRFEFRGVRYDFWTHLSSNSATPEQNAQNTEWLVEKVRGLGNYLYKGSVTLDGNGGKLSSDVLEEDIDLFEEGYAVTAVHITRNNELIILDELREGECVFTEYRNYATSDGFEIRGAVIYYVDPLPTPDVPEDEEPKIYTIFEIAPELKYYFVNPENVLLKLSKEHSPAIAGEFNKHLYKNEADDIALWLDGFFDITLIETTGPHHSINQPHFRYGVSLSDKYGNHGEVSVFSECGEIYIDGKWYSKIDGEFPIWDGGRPVLSFSCTNYDARVENSEVHYNVFDLEFREDEKQDYSYPDTHNTITLVGEFGQITVFDATHFYFNGRYYLVEGQKNFGVFWD